MSKPPSTEPRSVPPSVPKSDRFETVVGVRQSEFESAHRSPASPEPGAESQPSDSAKAVGMAGFCRILLEHKLSSPEELERYKSQLSPDQASDPRALARTMIQSGKITKFQAKQLLAGKSDFVMGNYVLLDRLGAGAMGMVFRARHCRMNRLVALKLLPPNFARDPSLVKRFQQEAQAAAQLHHPNIVTAFDADEFKGAHFLIMQYVDGTNLEDLVQNHGPLSLPRAVDFVVQAARGLMHAHHAGVIHRDIKPSNLIVDAEGVVRVLDMGLARIKYEGTSNAVTERNLTRAGDLMGTPSYMAPEQASDIRGTDGRADIYSLGCTLFFLATGKEMFVRQTGMETIMAHQLEERPLLGDHCPGVPTAMETAFQKMVAKQRDARFATMEEAIRALEPLVGELSGPLKIPQLSVQVSPDGSLNEKDQLEWLDVADGTEHLGSPPKSERPPAERPREPAARPRDTRTLDGRSVDGRPERVTRPASANPPGRQSATENTRASRPHGGEQRFRTLHAPAPAPAPASASRPRRKRKRESPWLWVLACVPFFLLLTLALVQLTRPKEQGILALQTADNTVQVFVRRSSDGVVVATLSLAKHEVRLPLGQYEIEANSPEIWEAKPQRLELLHSGQSTTVTCQKKPLVLAQVLNPTPNQAESRTFSQDGPKQTTEVSLPPQKPSVAPPNPEHRPETKPDPRDEIPVNRPRNKPDPRDDIPPRDRPFNPPDKPYLGEKTPPPTREPARRLAKGDVAPNIDDFHTPPDVPFPINEIPVRNNVTLLLVFDPTSPKSEQVIKELKSLHFGYRDELFIVLVTEDTGINVHQFMEKHRPPFAVAERTDLSVGYDAEPFPQAYLVDNRGKIAFHGQMPGSSSALTSAIKNLLGNPNSKGSPPKKPPHNPPRKRK